MSMVHLLMHDGLLFCACKKQNRGWPPNCPSVKSYATIPTGYTLHAQGRKSIGVGNDLPSGIIR